MGGGQVKEHILITLPIPEPTEQITRLKERFPGTTVVFKQSGPDPLPEEVYRDATVLFTLFGELL